MNPLTGWLYTIIVVALIGLPPLLGSFLRRRFFVPWLLFVAGMLTFALSQAVHLPLNHWLGDLGFLPKAGEENSLPLWQTALILGLTAGVCEELARAVGYAVFKRFPSQKGLTFGGGVMLGLGHGGIEAMVFGGIQLAAGVSALIPWIGKDLTNLGLSPAQTENIQTQIRFLLTSPGMALIPALERLLAIGLHITLSLMVWRAFRGGRGDTLPPQNHLRFQPGWLVFAILYHTLVDAVAVWAVQTQKHALVMEAGFFVLALPGYIWVLHHWKRESAARLPSEIPIAATLRRELSILFTGLRKEILQQWHTKRLLVVAVVFGLFGLISPLTAKFIPEMLTMIPGAEQFAALIPAATTGDAMYQYHKNLTQFGFILALLLGMGSVAGEKEHGTASLSLSKPLTRWAFLFSKLIIQTGMYFIGLALAFLGASLYTYVLFGSFDVMRFLLMNAALFMWLLPFTAITLLGSVIGATTGAAAGVALVGVVFLFASSAIPPIAPLMPGALSTWADQLGILAAGISPASPGSLTLEAAEQAAIMGIPGGALATSLVLSVVCLILALAIFEQQEL